MNDQKTQLKERLDKVIAYAIPIKRSNNIMIFEIGKGVNGTSRVSEVDKNTGEEHGEYIPHSCGYTNKSPIEKIQQYLRCSFLERELIKSRVFGLVNTLCMGR